MVCSGEGGGEVGSSELAQNTHPLSLPMTISYTYMHMYTLDFIHVRWCFFCGNDSSGSM